jgi:hypothetical protein
MSSKFGKFLVNTKVVVTREAYKEPWLQGPSADVALPAACRGNTGPYRALRYSLHTFDRVLRISTVFLRAKLYPVTQVVCTVACKTAFTLRHCELILSTDQRSTFGNDSARLFLLKSRSSNNSIAILLLLVSGPS